jgi:putative DNA primase/helicase
VTPSSTLDTGNKSAIPNDVAALANRRLVWASETEQTSTLNEAKVKQLVHGDEITARLMYKEFFTFTPVAKFWFTVNDLPTVRDGSHGMWRSLHVIPFLAQFDGDKADPNLTDTLKAELAGILNWAIKGCMAWQEQGLRPPTQVSDATMEYRQENDVLAEFIASCCEVGEEKSEAAAALYKSYTQWAERSGLKERDVLRNKAFYKQLKTKFKSKRTNKGIVYIGLQTAPMTEPR